MPSPPVLFICWAAITGALAVLLIYRSLISMKEDDQLFLDPAEWQLEREQRTILTQLSKLTPFVVGLVVASITLLILMAGVWIHHAIQRTGPVSF
jgi:hypothetical protein